MRELNKSIAHIAMPERMRSREISSKGYPVPWFVTLKKPDGDWDFVNVDPHRELEAHQKKCCWLCGKRLGVYKVFAIGPMCAINRVSSDAPAHIECARYAVMACPFLANPRMVRNDTNRPPPELCATPGLMLERNPGVICLWTTKEYTTVHPDPTKGLLFRIGDPVATEWWRERRKATYAEVMASVESGMPFLEDAAKLDGPEGVRALERYVARARPIFATAA